MNGSEADARTLAKNGQNGRQMADHDAITFQSHMCAPIVENKNEHGRIDVGETRGKSKRRMFRANRAAAGPRPWQGRFQRWR